MLRQLQWILQLQTHTALQHCWELLRRRHPLQQGWAGLVLGTTQELLLHALLQRAHYDATGEVHKTASEEFVEAFAGGEDLIAKRRPHPSQDNKSLVWGHVAPSTTCTGGTAKQS